MFFKFENADEQLKKAATIFRVIGYIFTVLLVLGAFIGGLVFYFRGLDGHFHHVEDFFMFVIQGVIAPAIVAFLSIFFTELITLFIYAKGELLEAAYDIVDNTEK